VTRFFYRPRGQGFSPQTTRGRGAYWLWPSVLCLLLGFVGVSLRANELTDGFDQANKWYAEGKYAEAIAAYQKLLTTGKVSAAIYFNLGNAFFKSGQIGRAIVNYDLAQNLSPRDPDLWANLQFARKTANAGVPVRLSRWRVWLHGMTLNEWAVLAAAVGWLWLTLLTLGQWRATLRQNFSGYTAAVGVACGLVAVGLGLRIYDEFATTKAVIVAREAIVRYGPLDESRNSYSLNDGAEVEVLDRQDKWLQVRDPARRTGWLRRDQAVVLAPGWGGVVPD
jgi:tetratricopeptide (TPR) repeat protein